MVLVWLTECLRRHDNPALHAAHGAAAWVAVEADPPLPPRAAAWRRRSLADLAAHLAKAGVPVLDAAHLDDGILRRLTAAGLREIHLDAGPGRREDALALRLGAAGLPVVRHGRGLLPLSAWLPPEEALPRSFSAFHRRFLARVVVPAPFDLPILRGPDPGLLARFASLRLIPPPADGGLPPGWRPGAAAAQRGLEAFLAREWPADPVAWERAGVEAGEPGGSSGLSPWLARGDLGARQVWAGLVQAAVDAVRRPLADALQRQLVWREYALALHSRHPDLEWEPLSPAWRDFPRRTGASRLAAWREGRCGIPVVDAALRQLAATGWMHNRLRMMAGTWLVKQMGQAWTDGLAVFREWLVDWDAALNAMNWQWCAGCGVDAQPWFRLFNPELQARRADPEGALLRRWLPELADLPLDQARRAWLLPADRRAALGYPLADPDPATGRAEALGAWAVFRGRRA
jgi:deoxyribodipyrimidine photo-lyase